MSIDLDESLLALRFSFHERLADYSRRTVTPGRLKTLVSRYDDRSVVERLAPRRFKRLRIARPALVLLSLLCMAATVVVLS